jgi:hypothetical protein
MVFLPDFAALSKDDLAKVQKLEKELNIVLLGFRPMQYARLPPDKLKKLQATEKELGVTIIAYR